MRNKRHVPSADDGDDLPKPASFQRTAPKFVRPTTLRVIGGELRRRPVVYHGDLATRPMKDSVRENLFNILGKAVANTVAWDLFSGTGILAIESISRGALRAVAFDLSRNSTKWIRQSAESLGIAERIDCITGDTFRLAPTRFKHTVGEQRTVFCSPPYKLWHTDFPRLLTLIQAAKETALPGSYLICETDHKFNMDQLPPGPWDHRRYGNTQLAFADLTELGI